MLKKLLIASLLYVGLTYTQRAEGPDSFVSPDTPDQEDTQANQIDEEAIEEEAIEIDQKPSANDEDTKILYSIKVALDKSDIPSLKQKLSEIRLTDRQLREITRHAQTVIKKIKIDLSILPNQLSAIRKNQEGATSTLFQKIAVGGIIQKIHTLHNKLVNAGRCLEILASTSSLGDEQEKPVIAPDVDNMEAPIEVPSTEEATYLTHKRGE